MQDDLIERLQLIAELSGRLTSSEVASIAKQAADRIAALEAKLAEKDALLRECGEALLLTYDIIDQFRFDSDADVWRLIDSIEKPTRTTLAKIKDATDAD